MYTEKNIRISVFSYRLLDRNTFEVFFKQKTQPVSVPELKFTPVLKFDEETCDLSMYLQIMKE